MSDICGICKQFSKLPIVHIVCNTVFCHSCIEFLSDYKCPCCDLPFDNIHTEFRSVDLDSDSFDTPIYMSHSKVLCSSEGCEKSFNTEQDLINHLIPPDRIHGCMEQIVNCRIGISLLGVTNTCGWQGKRKDFLEHHGPICPLRQSEELAIWIHKAQPVLQSLHSQHHNLANQYTSLQSTQTQSIQSQQRQYQELTNSNHNLIQQLLEERKERQQLTHVVQQLTDRLTLVEENHSLVFNTCKPKRTRLLLESEEQVEDVIFKLESPAEHRDVKKIKCEQEAREDTPPPPLEEGEDDYCNDSSRTSSACSDSADSEYNTLILL